MRGHSLLVLLVVVAACAGADAPKPLPPVDNRPAASLTEAEAQAACGAFAPAFCARYATCVPNLFAALFADEADCVARQIASCGASFSLYGIKVSAAELTACGNKLASSCDFFDRFDSEMGEACGLRGAMPDGQPCVASAQCAGGTCRTETGCGLCSRLRDEGEPCGVAIKCGAGLACSESGACRVPAGVGGACDPDVPCGPFAACDGGTCVEVGGLGQPCDGIECRGDLGCPVATCVALQTSADNVSCDLTAEPAALCANGACNHGYGCETYPSVGDSCSLHGGCGFGAWCNADTQVCEPQSRAHIENRCYPPE